MKRGVAVASVVFVICVCQATSGATWYVDASVSVAGDGTSWERALKKIQAGIDAAWNGDSVVVAEGDYSENIRFRGTNIALTSTDPLDARVVAATLIRALQVGPVVTFTGSEDESCVLKGFTISHGSADNAAGICGGTEQNHTHATIRYNVITENQAVREWPHGRGGGIAFCDGLIEHNRIIRNSARHGGGLYGCNGTISNNVIVGNSAELNGGGLHVCQGTIENNTIVRNSAEYGGGLSYCSGTIRNCVIWGNGGGSQLVNCSTPTYSCIGLWMGGGEGNISQCPYFVDAVHGDYHLKSWSPCIDAGDPASDFSKEPDPNGSRINMGAYGNTPEATSASADGDEDGLPDDWEIAFFGDISQGGHDDPDGDLLSNAEEYHRGLGPKSSLMVWYVDVSARKSGDGMTWETAFHTIQEGLDAADDGDTVIVSPGTYLENIEFSGEDVILKSSDPDDPSIVQRTVIDGGKWGSVVSFLGTESESCVLAGFTIRNGSALYGGGIRGDGTQATVRNNRVIGNLADWTGGGLYGCDGTVEGNTISDNRAFEGGGLAYCGATVCSNSIIRNAVAGNGGGLYACAGTIERNQITENRAFEGGGLAACDGSIRLNTITNNSAEGSGAGLYDCNGAVRNNLIIANNANGSGGGLHRCRGTIENDTIAYNFGQQGSGLCECTASILNCIIWGNRGGDQLAQCTIPTYSCIQDWTGGGVGNISFLPYFVDARGGDFHLWSWSPCVDAGDPASPFSNEPEPNGGRIDIGAYGNTPEATSGSRDNDEDLLPDDWELHFFGDLEQGPSDDPDADGLSNLEEFQRGKKPSGPDWHVDASVSPSGNGTSWERAFKTIQEAINMASDGDTVAVAEGTYLEKIRFNGKNIVLRSTDPTDPSVVQNTIISGRGNGTVVTFAGTETESCILSGFTIRDGNAQTGGGMYGAGSGHLSRATIENNIITSNQASIRGGGLAYCYGIIRNNTISQNSGGGLSNCDGLIQNNVIAGNSANAGGGLLLCNGVIQRNTTVGNQASEDGGGLAYCGGTITNNIIANNSASQNGGGLASCSGIIENNTIARNRASSGGGLYDCTGVVRNCIVWQNRAGDNSQLSGCAEPTYSCIQDYEQRSEGNISAYPYFVGSAKGNYHLRSWSPCIDAGDPSSDFSNEPQPNGGRIDIGAYGNTPEATSASPDSDGDLLPDDWEKAFFRDLAQGPDDDPDGDLVSNAEEYRRGTNPWSGFPHWYVDASVTAPGDGTSWERAFKTIQQGIDAAWDDETVMVAPGTYVENIQFKGLNIVLRSKDPQDPAVVAATIIDGNQAGSVVTFDGTEDETCLLSGFTIRNGRRVDSGGGINGQGTHATIESNTVTANETYGDLRVRGGGGLYDCDGTIRNNIITGNSAHGAGCGLCPPAGGGGLSGCDGVIQNNVISGNGADIGGGLYYCNGVIQNNTITGNSAWDGGGLAYCNGVIQNNTIITNSAAGSGGGLCACNGTILNCIIWGNTGGQLASSGVPSYSCIEGWTGGGEGNISYYPHFAGPPGDCHLLSWSPCIDAGDPASDFSSEPEPNGGRIDMGAYGNTPEATSGSLDSDGDLLPDDWEMALFGDLSQGADDDPDGDLLSNVEEYRLGKDPKGLYRLWYVNASITAPGDGTSWETAFKTIQKGIAAALHGSSVLVAPGTYLENIHFGGKNIVLRSKDPLDPAIVAATIIDGNQAGSVVTFDGTEDETCILSGFTIRNGRSELAGSGGGIKGNATHATISYNVIRGNAAPGFLGGGGLGGGLAYCDGTIEYNTITANSASYGGGLYGCHGTIQNNVITRNSAAGYGGGLDNCNGTIQNNTIAGNSAWHGGGLYGCNGTILNCIIWGNTGGQLASSRVPSYSCIEGWTGGGEGNIAYYPYFVHITRGDYHLASWSPCIDAGDPASDFSNEPQPNGGRVDMGAYGNTPEATSKSPDADSDGLPDSWEVHWFGNLQQDAEGNSDGGALSNLDEYRSGLDPTALDQEAYNVRGGTWHLTVQDALSQAENGDEIVVYPGVYRENINFDGKNVVLRSAEPSDPHTVAGTVLDGRGSGPVVTFSGAEGEGCLLCGFTIRNGHAGISGAGTHATIQNNVITGNVEGAGLRECDGIIQNNTIAGNWAATYAEGGGLNGCDGIIRNNTITGNSARHGSGGGLSGCNGIIQNNTITGNWAAWSGGGLSGCSGMIENNTIGGNSAAESGGGLYQCSGIIRNCIIWGNTAPTGPQLYESSGPSYSCIEGWAAGGKANIALDPNFVDPDGADNDPATCEDNNYRLSAASPCIDAGYNDRALPATDIAGMHRIMFGGKSLTVDMGAYEYYVNTLTPGPEPQQTTLTWSSWIEVTYSIFYSDDLMTWHLADDDVPSAGFDTTSWIDDGSATGAPPSLVPIRFYRILENPQ